jgi:hypothetical protein
MESPVPNRQRSASRGLSCGDTPFRTWFGHGIRGDLAVLGQLDHTHLLRPVPPDGGSQSVESGPWRRVVDDLLELQLGVGEWAARQLPDGLGADRQRSPVDLGPTDNRGVPSSPDPGGLARVRGATRRTKARGYAHRTTVDV